MLRKLVLFDIDGTLLHTHGAGRRAIHAALLGEVVAPAQPSRVRFDGKTDPQIVRELLAEVAHADQGDESRIAAVCRRYVDLLAEELRSGSCRITVYPGVADLLDRIEVRQDTVLGLLTGNVVDGARLKLRFAGIDPARFRVGAFGSDHHERAELPAIAARRAAAVLGHAPSGADIVIVGDTPADMTCGRAVGARAIGVATGAYSATELQEAGGYAAFDSFADLEPVLHAIYA